MSYKHTVVIVNYNGTEDTLACIASIKECTDVPHIIVVDNGSTNDSALQLKKAYKDLDLLTSSINLGFSGGYNLGIRHALNLDMDVVYILNNDTLVAKDLFSKSYPLVHHKQAIVTGKIYYAKGFEYHKKDKNKGDVLWYAGGHFDKGSVVALHDFIDQEDEGQANQAREVDFISGCFMALSKEVISTVGLLDPSFFLYLEDVDYCLRAQAHNIALRYEPSLILYHKNGGSAGAGSPLVDYYMTRNRLLIGFRYGDLRLKIALLREALTRNWNSTIRRTAFIDFLLQRLGNQNDTISTISQKN